MRVQIFIICFLASIIAWGVAFDVARDSYRAGQEAGLVPNLHIKHRMRQIIHPGISGLLL
jgi:hypothetical protein